MSSDNDFSDYEDNDDDTNIVVIKNGMSIVMSVKEFYELKRLESNPEKSSLTHYPVGASSSQESSPECTFANKQECSTNTSKDGSIEILKRFNDSGECNINFVKEDHLKKNMDSCHLSNIHEKNKTMEGNILVDGISQDSKSCMLDDQLFHPISKSNFAGDSSKSCSFKNYTPFTDKELTNYKIVKVPCKTNSLSHTTPVSPKESNSEFVISNSDMDNVVSCSNSEVPADTALTSTVKRTNKIINNTPLVDNERPLGTGEKESNSNYEKLDMPKRMDSENCVIISDRCGEIIQGGSVETSGSVTFHIQPKSIDCSIVSDNEAAVTGVADMLNPTPRPVSDSKAFGSLDNHCFIVLLVTLFRLKKEYSDKSSVDLLRGQLDKYIKNCLGGDSFLSSVEFITQMVFSDDYFEANKSDFKSQASQSTEYVTLCLGDAVECYQSSSILSFMKEFKNLVDVINKNAINSIKPNDYNRIMNAHKISRSGPYDLVKLESLFINRFDELVSKAANCKKKTVPVPAIRFPRQNGTETNDDGTIHSHITNSADCLNVIFNKVCPRLSSTKDTFRHSNMSKCNDENITHVILEDESKTHSVANINYKEHDRASSKIVRNEACAVSIDTTMQIEFLKSKDKNDTEQFPCMSDQILDLVPEDIGDVKLILYKIIDSVCNQEIYKLDSPGATIDDFETEDQVEPELTLKPKKLTGNFVKTLLPSLKHEPIEFSKLTETSDYEEFNTDEKKVNVKDQLECSTKHYSINRIKQHISESEVLIVRRGTSCEKSLVPHDDIVSEEPENGYSPLDLDKAVKNAVATIKQNITDKFPKKTIKSQKYLSREKIFNFNTFREFNIYRPRCDGKFLIVQSVLGRISDDIIKLFQDLEKGCIIAESENMRFFFVCYRNKSNVLKALQYNGECINGLQIAVSCDDTFSKHERIKMIKYYPENHKPGTLSVKASIDLPDIKLWKRFKQCGFITSILGSFRSSNGPLYKWIINFMDETDAVFAERKMHGKMLGNNVMEVVLLKYVVGDKNDDERSLETPLMLLPSGSEVAEKNEKLYIESAKKYSSAPINSIPYWIIQQERPTLRRGQKFVVVKAVRGTVTKIVIGEFKHLNPDYLKVSENRMFFFAEYKNEDNLIKALDLNGKILDGIQVAVYLDMSYTPQDKLRLIPQISWESRPGSILASPNLGKIVRYSFQRYGFIIDATCKTKDSKSLRPKVLVSYMSIKDAALAYIDVHDSFIDGVRISVRPNPIYHTCEEFDRVVKELKMLRKLNLCAKLPRIPSIIVEIVENLTYRDEVVREFERIGECVISHLSKAFTVQYTSEKSLLKALCLNGKQIEKSQVAVKIDDIQSEKLYLLQYVPFDCKQGHIVVEPCHQTVKLDLEKLFKEFGWVTSCIYRSFTNQAFVSYMFAKDAYRALVEMNGRKICNCDISVSANERYNSLEDLKRIAMLQEVPADRSNSGKSTNKRNARKERTPRSPLRKDRKRYELDENRKPTSRERKRHHYSSNSFRSPCKKFRYNERKSSKSDLKCSSKRKRSRTPESPYSSRRRTEHSRNRSPVLRSKERNGILRKSRRNHSRDSSRKKFHAEKIHHDCTPPHSNAASSKLLRKRNTSEGFVESKDPPNVRRETMSSRALRSPDVSKRIFFRSNDIKTTVESDSSSCSKRVFFRNSNLDSKTDGEKAALSDMGNLDDIEIHKYNEQKTVIGDVDEREFNESNTQDGSWNCHLETLPNEVSKERKCSKDEGDSHKYKDKTNIMKNYSPPSTFKRCHLTPRGANKRYKTRRRRISNQKIICVDVPEKEIGPATSYYDYRLNEHGFFVPGTDQESFVEQTPLLGAEDVNTTIQIQQPISITKAENSFPSLSYNNDIRRIVNTTDIIAPRSEDFLHHESCSRWKKLRDPYGPSHMEHDIGLSRNAFQAIPGLDTVNDESTFGNEENSYKLEYDENDGPISSSDNGITYSTSRRTRRADIVNDFMNSFNLNPLSSDDDMTYSNTLTENCGDLRSLISGKNLSKTRSPTPLSKYSKTVDNQVHGQHRFSSPSKNSYIWKDCSDKNYTPTKSASIASNEYIVSDKADLSTVNSSTSNPIVYSSGPDFAFPEVERKLNSGENILEAERSSVNDGETFPNAELSESPFPWDDIIPSPPCKSQCTKAKPFLPEIKDEGINKSSPFTGPKAKSDPTKVRMVKIRNKAGKVVKMREGQYLKWKKRRESAKKASLFQAKPLTDDNSPKPDTSFLNQISQDHQDLSTKFQKPVSTVRPILRTSPQNSLLTIEQNTNLDDLQNTLIKNYRPHESNRESAQKESHSIPLTACSYLSISGCTPKYVGPYKLIPLDLEKAASGRSNLHFNIL